MQLTQPTKNLFSQLQFVLQDLTPGEYIQPSETLFNVTIGQHVRHIIELFIELNSGYENGVVDYEKRKRDYRIETDKYFAIKKLDEILIELNKEDKALKLYCDYAGFNGDAIVVSSNYYREVIYNLEHAVHHMALIRIGISEISSLKVPDEFGVAASTIKYRSSVCVQ